ncbi:hypothetical protein [Rhodobacter sp. SY28-1]|uniref:hypothetical protein n=1 Tax=Rhodobacter sp. SY28-1 TaxID=2562317 RepID=UPI0010C0249C|nr:hypothetical protein [Rhodobacter sp. SY28-1]
MWNFSLLKALAVWGRLAPLMVVRLVMFGLVALVLGIAIGLGAWIGIRFQLVGGTADAVLGGSAAFLLAAVALAIWGRARLQMLRSQLLALVVDLVDGVRVPMGQGQIAHARSAVAARFGSSSQLWAIHRFVRGVAGKVPAVAEGVGPLMSMPLLGRLASGGLVTQAVLAHAYRARPENAWEAAHDGLVMSTQNARDLLGTAGRINGVGWLLTLTLFLLLLPPFVGLAALWPAAGPTAGAIAAGLAALALRAALIQPLTLACLWQAFLRITAGQEPLGEWRGRLTQVSAPFRDLGDQAVGWSPDLAAVP